MISFRSAMGDIIAFLGSSSFLGSVAGLLLLAGVLLNTGLCFNSLITFVTFGISFILGAKEYGAKGKFSLKLLLMWSVALLFNPYFTVSFLVTDKHFVYLITAALFLGNALYGSNVKDDKVCTN